jgi:hypothetical protein
MARIARSRSRFISRGVHSAADDLSPNGSKLRPMIGAVVHVRVSTKEQTAQVPIAIAIDKHIVTGDR